jgi:hypothetical protein
MNPRAQEEHLTAEATRRDAARAEPDRPTEQHETEIEITAIVSIPLSGRRPGDLSDPSDKAAANRRREYRDP